MIEDRVGELRLRIRTDLPDAEVIRPAAERVVRIALDRCAALLEARAPGRVVLMRRLPLRWRFDESLLDDTTSVDELAKAAADAIERFAIPASLEPPADIAGAVLFDDEAHLRASHLLALARGRLEWFHVTLERPESGDPLALLAAPQRRATAHATLVRLAREGVLAEVLASQPASAVAVLATALGCKTPSRLGELESAAAQTGFSTALASELVTDMLRWPTLAAPAQALALRAHAAVLLGVGMEAPESIALSAAVHDGQFRSSSAPQHTTPTPQPFAKDSVDAKLRPLTGKHSTAPEETQAPMPVAAAGESVRLIATRCAGLFYLLDRVQEIDLAESLWKVCLPEGKLFAAATAALLGVDFVSDAAPALFGGIDALSSCPEVSLEQHEEVAISTCAALAAALPRRGLAELPSVRVALAYQPAGRLLTAAAEGSPFVFFAWPATEPAMLRAGLRALLDAWPHSGRLAADPALASLDSSGRLRQCSDAEQPPPFVPAASSTPAAALLALIVGAPCLLFATRAGAPSPDTVAAFVARYLARPGRIRLGPGQMDVILSSDALDFEARRSGLDRDPGWLPWLRRSVRFVFEERATPDGQPTTLAAWDGPQ